MSDGDEIELQSSVEQLYIKIHVDALDKIQEL